MTNFKYKLPLKLSPYSNHSLSWSIRDEISHGQHTFEGLYALVLGGEINNLRRYAEVLIGKTKQEDFLLRTLEFSFNKRIEMGLDSMPQMINEFRDWGFYYDSTNERVNVNYKKAEKEV